MRARAVGWLTWAGIVLLAYPWWPAPQPAAGGGLTWRLAGPVAGLAASALWVQFAGALRAGDTDRAYSLAGRALRLDPWSPKGWATLGEHLISDRGSRASEPDPRRRVEWVVLGLGVLRRGEERSSDPGALAVIQGTYRLSLADRVGPDLPWPGGADALFAAARDDLARAAAHGHPRAAGLLELLERPRDGQED